jgi:hypothetical protein
MLTILGIYVSFLEKLFQVDSFLANVPKNKEVQHEEWRVERQVLLQHHTFDMYHENKLQSKTHFSYSALRTLKDFFGFPPVM